MSFDYTERSHLKYGKLPSGNAFTKIGAGSRALRAPIEEAVLAARAIDRAARGEQVLLMSGGIDSEAMAESFLAAGIKFRVAIIRFENRLNEFDISDARSFCLREKIDFEEFDFDVLDFLARSGPLKYAYLDECRSPQLAVLCEALLKISGFPVMSWNPSAPYWRGDSLDIQIPFEPHLSFLRYFARMSRPAVPFFFAYTPELIYSFFHTPTMQARLLKPADDESRKTLADRFGLKSPPDKYLTRYLEKVATYAEGGFAAKARGSKATGFEKIKEHFRSLWPEGGALEDHAQDSIFDITFRRPLERLYPYPKQTFKFLDSTFMPPTAGTTSSFETTT